MAFNVREQRLTAIVLLLAGIWASLKWGLDPLLQRHGELAQQVESQTAKLERLGALMASRSVVEKEYSQVEPFLNAAISQNNEPSAFFSELEGLARQADVKIDLKPRASGAREEGRLAVELELRAPQERLFALIDSILTMPQLIQIQRLHLAPAPGTEGELRAHLILSKLSLTP